MLENMFKPGGTGELNMHTPACRWCCCLLLQCFCLTVTHQDSPVGLAAWILEKIRTWSDCGDTPDNALSKDKALNQHLHLLRCHQLFVFVSLHAAAAACSAALFLDPQDSPVGLAAWILEKVRTWSDCGGVPDNALSKDEVLTNICVYWFSGRIASSMRLYKESLRNKWVGCF